MGAQGPEVLPCVGRLYRPARQRAQDYLGAFAVTAGIGADEMAKHFEAEYDDYNAILAKALADRLAEAFAEWLHKRVREDWGYGREERWTPQELIDEAYRGIRPALATRPVLTTPKSGFCSICWHRKERRHPVDRELCHVPGRQCQRSLLCHPQGAIFCRRSYHADQVEDYARRRGMPLAEVERWLHRT